MNEYLFRVRVDVIDDGESELDYVKVEAKLCFDYEYLNYHFTRYELRSPIDEYIVIRTSRRCFRCMYFNYRYNYFEYFSEETSRETAEHMEKIFEKMKRAEK